MKKHTKITLLIVFVVLIVGGYYAYNAFLFMWFIKPGDGGHNNNLEMIHVAGNRSGEAGFEDGTGDEVLMAKPIRLASLNDSTVVFADINNHAIRSIDLKGNVKTIVGGPAQQGYQDGPAITAKINSPHGIAVRRDGVIAIAEANNNTIRLLTPIQTLHETDSYYEVSTLAGEPGDGGFKDGNNNKARFSAPHAVVWGPNNELYVADIGNARIRMIKDGRTTTVAGREKTGAKDGGLKIGTLRYPMDMVLDNEGNLWIIDAAELIIRKWNKEEGLTTPFPGQEIAMPHGIAFDEKRKQIIVAEMYGQRILAFDISSGLVSTICGSAQEGNDAHHLRKPAAVLVQNDLIWIADLGNNRIVAVEYP